MSDDEDEATDARSLSRPDRRVPCTRLVTAPPDPLAREEAHRALVRAMAVTHEHVAPLVSVDVRDDVLVITHLLPSGWSTLADVLDAAPPLTAGQVITLGVPVAQAVRAIGRAGAGVVGPVLDHVVLDAQGRPELALTAACSVVRGDEQRTVAGLAGQLRELLAEGTAPGSMVLVLLRAADGMGASDFASSLLRCAPPEALPRRASLPPGLPSETAAPPRGEPVAPEQPRPRGPDPVGALRPGRRTTVPVAVRWGAFAPTTREQPPGPPPTPLAPMAPAAAIDVPEGRRPARGRSDGRRAGRGRLRSAVAVLVFTGVAAASGVAWATVGRVAAAGEPVPSTPAVVVVPSTSTTSRTTPSSTTPSSTTPSSTTPSSTTPSSTTPSTSSSSVPPLATAAAVEWAAVLGALDRARVAAWAAGDESALAAVDLPGSRAMRQDTAALRRLLGAGLRPDGLSWRVVSAMPQTGTTSAVAVLEVVDARSGYLLLDADGLTAARVPPGATRRWEVVLARDSTGEWRVREVRTREPGAPR